MKGYFSYDEIEGFRVHNSLEDARENAGMLKEEEEITEGVVFKGHRVLICYGTIEEIVLTNDTDLVETQDLASVLA